MKEGWLELPHPSQPSSAPFYLHESRVYPWQEKLPQGRFVGYQDLTPYAITNSRERRPHNGLRRSRTEDQECDFGDGRHCFKDSASVASLGIARKWSVRHIPCHYTFCILRRRMTDRDRRNDRIYLNLRSPRTLLHRHNNRNSSPRKRDSRRLVTFLESIACQPDRQSSRIRTCIRACMGSPSRRPQIHQLSRLA